MAKNKVLFAYISPIMSLTYIEAVLLFISKYVNEQFQTIHTVFRTGLNPSKVSYEKLFSSDEIDGLNRICDEFQFCLSIYKVDMNMICDAKPYVLFGNHPSNILRLGVSDNRIKPIVYMEPIIDMGAEFAYEIQRLNRDLTAAMQTSEAFPELKLSTDIQCEEITQRLNELDTYILESRKMSQEYQRLSLIQELKRLLDMAENSDSKIDKADIIQLINSY